MFKFLTKKIPIWQALIVIIIWTLLFSGYTYSKYLEVKREKEMEIPEVRAPEILYCDAVTACPEGKECYKFEDEENPICWSGNPCQRCASKVCDIAESYPMQVFCK